MGSNVVITSFSFFCRLKGCNARRRMRKKRRRRWRRRNEGGGGGE